MRKEPPQTTKLDSRAAQPFPGNSKFAPEWSRLSSVAILTERHMTGPLTSTTFYPSVQLVFFFSSGRKRRKRGKEGRREEGRRKKETDLYLTCMNSEKV